MFKKYKCLSEHESLETAVISYKSVIDLAKSWCSLSSPNESVVLLDYLIDTLINDICIYQVSLPIYKGFSNAVRHPFPTSCKDEYSKEISCFTGRKISIELSKTPTFTTPRDSARTRASLIRLQKEEFEFNPLNHDCYYYPEINLCYVGNGNHSINAGRYFKKGTVEASEILLSKLFPHIETDGVNWLSIHHKSPIDSLKIPDFRFAAIYSLAQMRYNLTRE